MKRMDKYKYTEETRESRLDKNQELYHNVSNNVVYTNLSDIKNSNAFELSDRRPTSYTSREAYQQMQKYQNMEQTPKVKKDLEDFNFAYRKRENKVYDINTVLEEARKNRQETDGKEEKRKLKNQSYNILLNMDPEEIERYREEKRKKITTPEEDELRELIDTIASKTLAGEIDKEITVDLLSDLMATNIMDKVEASSELPEDEPVEERETIEIEISKTVEIKDEPDKIEKEEIETKEDELSLSRQILSSEEIEKINEEAKKDIEPQTEKDEDFYTKSMDLSDKDFEMCEEFKEKKIPPIVIAIIVLVIMALLATAGYFIYKRFI